MSAESTEMKHVSEDLLERYSLQQLPEEQLAPVEEHLLVCELCQRTLTEVDDYVCSLKIAARQVTEETMPARRLQTAPRRPLQWLLPLSSGALIASLLIFVYVGKPQTQPPSDVTLTATRGASPSNISQAPAHAMLTIKVDAGDVSAGPLRLELVNEQGKTVWLGSGETSQGRLAVKITRPLDAGLYWFRVYESDRLHQEYGLQVK
jgi:hypothetical protein